MPTTNTTASMPVTGNGSVAGVIVDQADQLLEPLDGQFGVAFLRGELESRHTVRVR